MSFDKYCYKCAYFGEGDVKASLKVGSVHYYYCPIRGVYVGTFDRCNHFKEVSE